METKQTAMQTLIEWGDEMIKQHPPKILSFAEAIDKAQELLQMEKEQIMESYWAIRKKDNEIIGAEQYYNQTYGTL